MSPARRLLWSALVVAVVAVPVSVVMIVVFDELSFPLFGLVPTAELEYGFELMRFRQLGGCFEVIAVAFEFE